MTNWTERDLKDALKLAILCEVFRAWLDDDNDTITNNLIHLQGEAEGLDLVLSDADVEEVQSVYHNFYSDVCTLFERTKARMEPIQEKRKSDGLRPITNAQIKEAGEILYSG